MATLNHNNHQSLINWSYDLDDPNQVEEVLGDENPARGDAGNLKAPGLTACLGVAVYDRTNETGYLAHFITQGKDSNELGNELMEFQFMMEQDGLDYSNSHAAVAGLEYDQELSDIFIEEPEEVREIASTAGKRELTERLLLEDIQESETYWGAEENYAGELRLNLNTGDITYNEAALKMQ